MTGDRKAAPAPAAQPAPAAPAEPAPAQPAPAPAPAQAVPASAEAAASEPAPAQPAPAQAAPAQAGGAEYGSRAGPGQLQPFAYAVLRAVPRVDRGEAMNAGILLYCRPHGYLAALIELDATRLLALDPAADVPAIERALAAIARVCAQEPGAGQASLQDIGRRFGWLTAPRSTVVQPGPVHTGLTTDPAAEAERLLRALVRLPS